MRPHCRADFVLSPAFLIALAILLLNDLVLKPHFPGTLSGIASDVAGMVFFPVFVVALAELASALLPCKPWASPRWFTVATVAVAVLFVLIKFTDVGGAVYTWAAGPVEGTVGQLLQLPQVGVVRDPWDLLAAPFGLVAVWLGYRWRGASGVQDATTDVTD